MASVVGTYARAFADVVVAPKNKLDSARALQELHSFEAVLAESDSLRRVLDNPSIPGDRKRAVLDAVTARLGSIRQVRNFVAVLIDHLSPQLIDDSSPTSATVDNIIFGFHQMEQCNNGVSSLLTTIFGVDCVVTNARSVGM